MESDQPMFERPALDRSLRLKGGVVAPHRLAPTERSAGSGRERAIEPARARDPRSRRWLMGASPKSYGALRVVATRTHPRRLLASTA